MVEIIQGLVQKSLLSICAKFEVKLWSVASSEHRGDNGLVIG